jgi:HlyD family secretion protein
MKVNKKLPILVVLVAVAAGSGYWFLTERNNNPSDEIRVSGNIEITDAEVSFKIPGRVAKRLVDEGMLVQKDQIVAELDSADLAWEVELRRWELKAAEAQLAELQAGSRPDEKAAAKAAMEKSKYALAELEDGSRWQKEIAEAALSEAEAELTRAESEYKRAQSLLEQRIIAKEDFDRRKTARDVALERVKQAASAD